MFASWSTNVPGPDLTKPWVPASTVPMVAVWLLTVIAGLPLVTASVSGPPLPVLSVQLWLGVVSPKNRPPRVRGPSSVTMPLAVRFIVPKSAVLSTPLAIVAPFQLPGFNHEPPAGLVQTPLLKLLAILILRMASAVRPAASATRTVKLLAPTSPLGGVPDSAPLVATLNQSGPDTRL